MLNIISLLKWLILYHSAWNKITVASCGRKLSVVMTVVRIISVLLDERRVWGSFWECKSFQGRVSFAGQKHEQPEIGFLVCMDLGVIMNLGGENQHYSDSHW